MCGSTGDGWHRFSVDGRWICFNSKGAGSVQVWRMFAGGGDETQVLESLLGECFDVNGNGIYYVGPRGANDLCPL
jgi:Tol biopolymer transport system component